MLAPVSSIPIERMLKVAPPSVEICKVASPPPKLPSWKISNEIAMLEAAEKSIEGD